jgi:hypothetical protein
MYHTAVAPAEDLAARREISFGQLALYRLHVDLAMANGGRSHPSRRWLADKLGVSLRTIDYWHARLVEVGLLERVPVYDGHSGWQTTNSYYVCALRRAPRTNRRRTVAFERRHDRAHRALVAAQRRSKLARTASPPGRTRFAPPEVDPRVRYESHRPRGTRTGVPTSVGEVIAHMERPDRFPTDRLTPPRSAPKDEVESVEPPPARPDSERERAREEIAKLREMLRR